MANVYLGTDIQTARTTSASRTFSPWTGFGTPKGLLFFGSNATTLGTSQVNAKWSVGMYDGTTQLCCVASHQNSVTTTSAKRTAFSDRICGVLANSGASITGEGTASWATDGVSVDYSPDPYPTAQQQVALLWGGADAKCKVIRCFFDMAINTTSSSIISSLSFAPTAVIFVGNRTQIDSDRGGSGAPNIANDGRMFIGFAAQVGAGIVQGSYNFHASDGVSTISGQVVGGIPSNTHALRPIADNATPALITDAAFEVTEFGSDYISIKKTVDSTDHYVAALVLGGINYHAEYKLTPTTATTQDVTGLAFDPLGLVSIMSMSQGSINSIDSSTSAATFGIGASGSPEATTPEGAVSISLDTAASPTSTLSHAKARAIYVSNPADSDKCDAQVNGGSGSWGTNKWTTSFTNVIGSGARHAWYLGIEKSEQTVSLGAATGTGNASAVTVSPGAATVALGAASALASAASPSVAPGDLFISLGAATGTATAATPSIAPGAVTIPLGAATSTATATAVTLNPGAVTIALGVAVSTGYAAQITVTIGDINFYMDTSNAIREKWETEVETGLSLPTQYDNLPFTKPVGAYARLYVDFDESEMLEFGGAGGLKSGIMIETRGRARARIHWPILDGQGDLDDLIDSIIVLFEDVEGTISAGDDVVHYYTPKVVDRRRRGARFIVEIEFPFSSEISAAVADRVEPELEEDRQGIGEALRTHWESEMEVAESLPTQYGNLDFDKPENTPYARIGIIEGDAFHVDPFLTRRMGVLLATIFTPIENGEATGLALIDAANRAFRHRRIQGVITHAPSPPRRGQKGAWFSHSISIPWTADHT